MVPTTLLPVHARALHEEPINAANSIEDDEEEAFLQANESVVLVFDIDVVRIVEQYRADKQTPTDSAKGLQSKSEVIGELSDLQDMDVSEDAWDYEELKKQHLLQAIQAEKNYEEQMSRTSRV